jgi:hypothetical protein
MAPAMARSVMPGFTHHCIITRCARMEALDAFLMRPISPSSLIWRNGMVRLVTSRACGAIDVPSVVAMKLSSAGAWGASGCVHKFCEILGSAAIAWLSSTGNSVICSTLSTPEASTTPGVAASIFSPVYFSMRRLRAGRNRISL